MWVFNHCADFGKRLAKYQKRHRLELARALANLNVLFVALCAGAKPRQVQRGFIHPEPKGVLAITGGTGKAVRLYVYPEEERLVLHVLTLGDKQSQEQDIKDCVGFVDELRQQSAEASSDGSMQRGEGGFQEPERPDSVG